MLEADARENYKTSAPGTAGILACAISYLQKVVVLESCEIARVEYLGHKTNIRSGRVRKL